MGTDTNTQTTPTETLPPVPPLIPLEQGSEIDAIRTETIFSRMPLHVLSKSGPRPQINIEKRSTDGRVEEKWKVSYNEEYGPARQLAYDVHTLVIERAIEEAFDEARRTGQPFPRLIPLSSLNDVASRLGPNAETRNTNRIKKALSQNAGILITAFKRYRGSDGVEYTIEGVFTPYGIFFFGQKLPGGERADQVYINLNDAYFEAWSRAATRPLDYNYKAQLPPIPRRFYELVSYAMYGAIKNSQPTARYRYSEFCKNAPQLRYDTFDQVKKQMYKIHKPHVDGGYILKVKYEQTTDEQGRGDWWMTYTPGPRAYVEFATFTGKKIPRTVDALMPAGESSAASQHRRRGPRQASLKLQPEVNASHLAALTSRGVTEPAARKVLATLPADFPIPDTLEWGDQQIATQQGKFTNPPGFYISLLRDRIKPPSTFESSQARKTRQEAELAQRQAIVEQQAAALAREEQERAEADAQLEQLERQDPAGYAQMMASATAEVFGRLPEWMRNKPDSSLHAGAIRAAMRRLLPAFLDRRTSQAQPEADQLPARPFDLQALLTTLQLPAPDPTLTEPELARPTGAEPR